MLKLTASLMELHDENPFKVKSYNNAVYGLERTDVTLASLSNSELENLDGVGKSMAAKISGIIATGELPELNRLLEITPAGVLKMMDIKGLGPKKLRTIWKELLIESPETLLEACENNSISKLKGFGEKTQEAIRQALLFTKENEGKVLFEEAELYANALLEAIRKASPDLLIEASGELRRKMEIVETLQFVVGTDHIAKTHEVISQIDILEKDKKLSGPFAWRGRLVEANTKVEFLLSRKEEFYSQLFIRTGARQHLITVTGGELNLMQIAQSGNFESEEAIYKKAGLPYIEPELREGLFEIDLALENKLPLLVEYSDMRGILHNHSTYSDGKNTLRDMAIFCREQGYEYLGISDHSQTAFYANGMKPETVLKQHEEIDRLNKELAPFKIFKGIESDILQDGSLDYEDELLARFDFIVASIHGNLKMSKEVATERLIRAIQNPYTTMLGHPTGRLLLRREGYPIDHKAVIDACAQYGVIMEINANPWRLDLDWRWVNYALEQGVMISINPDAHETGGYRDMYYGVCVGRKGGLTKEKTFNALSLVEVEAHFKERKRRIQSSIG